MSDSWHDPGVSRLQVHRSNRMEQLVSVLGDVVSKPLSSPLDPEIVVVANKGMERWIALQLCERFGIWSNARYPFPRSFLESVFDSVAPLPPESRPFSPDTLRFILFSELTRLPDTAEFAPLTRYLASEASDQKRLHLAEKLAAVFDQYAVYRPELVLSWQAGEGEGWQPELWRRIERVTGPTHLAARAQAFFDRWRRMEHLPDGFPRRVSLVGLSHLPPIYLKVLAALAERIDLHVFVLTPSREYMGDVLSGKEVSRALRRSRSAAEQADDLHLLEDNPLIAALGRAGRDFQQVLETVAEYHEDDRDLFVEPGHACALSTLQSDLLALRTRSSKHPESPPIPLVPGDRSLAVHVCHSAMREVEVLRDQLLAAFDADPTLEPRDVIVMAPDIEPYAPLIDAVFNVEQENALHIPYRIADRSQRRQSVVVESFMTTLATLRSRFKASEVLDLLQLDPVRQRFGIESDELPRLSRYVHEAGVRWAVDDQDREAHGQPALAQNTWRFGLRRLLLGVAMSADRGRTFADVLPYDDTDIEGATAIGKLVELCETLFSWRGRLEGSHTVAEWRALLLQLFADTVHVDDDTGWEGRLLRDVLTAFEAHAALANFDEPIGIDLIEELLQGEFGRQRSAHEFLSGGVTFCAMLPMRSVPFRVVYLLGLNDGAFPRANRSPSFDLMASEPRPGDRSPRDEDRYLFLEALLSARERLFLSYVGQSVQDGSERPPSVVVGELLDVVDASFRPPQDNSAQTSKRAKASARQASLFFTLPDAAEPEPIAPRFTIKHPLQPFSPRYFDGSSSLFSYAPAEAAGARRLLEGRTALRQFQTALLPPSSEPKKLEFDALVRFFENPQKALLQQVLGLYLEGEPDLVADREPFEPRAIERYTLGNTLLDHALRGLPLEQGEELLRGLGLLPLGTVGTAYFATLLPEVRTIVDRARAYTHGSELEPLAFELIAGDTTLVGALRGVWPGAAVRVQYSRVKPKNELAAWVRHIALCALAEVSARPTVLVGRTPDPKDDNPAALRRFAPVARERAQALLSELVQLYWDGQRAPLCLFPDASKTLIATWRARADADDALEQALVSARERYKARILSTGRGELDDPYVRCAFGDLEPIATEFRPFAEYPHDFVALSRRVFEPLLDHMEDLS